MFLVSSSLYFSFLCLFSFVSHPVAYCFLLLGSSLWGCVGCYSVMGFSWYLVLLCLVYIGGVYILFIFVSVHTPNSSTFFSVGWVAVLCFCFFVVFVGSLWFVGFGFSESSHMLCSYYEGFSYCLFCVFILLGFAMISLVSSEKGSFYR